MATSAKKPHVHRNVVMTAAIAGLGGLLFGHDTGIIASALLLIKKDLGLDSFEQGLVVAAVPVGAIGGAALSGPLADKYGRRLMILASAVVFIIGALISAAADSLAVLTGARVFVGVAIGIASAAAPVYISEVAPPESRGRMVSFFQLSVTIGILVAYLVGLAFTSGGHWRWMLGLGCVPAFALGIGMLRMPQSPRWLVMVGRDYEARAISARMRSGDPETIEHEIDEIKGSIDAKPASWSELLTPVVRAALIVGVGMAILQQVTGINTVIYYAPTIVQFTGAFVGGGGSGTLGSVVAILSLMLRRGIGDQPGSDLLVDQRRDLSAQRPQQGRRHRHDGQLDVQLHRLAHVPRADRRTWAKPRSGCTGRDRHIHALVLLEAGDRDQGQDARGDPHRVRAARGRGSPRRRSTGRMSTHRRSTHRRSPHRRPPDSMRPTPAAVAPRSCPPLPPPGHGRFVRRSTDDGRLRQR